MDKVNLAEKFNIIEGYWNPGIAGELNGQYVKLAKLKGEFVWHSHELEDEFFLVISGKLTIKLRDREIELNEGEFFIVPRGMEHMPVAEEEVHVMVFEPAGTLNTGDAKSDLKIDNPEWI